MIRFLNASPLKSAARVVLGQGNQKLNDLTRIKGQKSKRIGKKNQKLKGKKEFKSEIPKKSECMMRH